MAVALGVLAFATYGFTAPASITLEDAGLFQMVCDKAGLPHPPGYPLFGLACSALLPGPDIWYGNLLSALFGALTIGVFYLLVIELTGSAYAALVAAVVYTLSATFWSQAIIIEVYTLAALLFFLSWLFLMRSVAAGSTLYWYLACLCFSLGLSNHWPLVLLSAPALLLVLWWQRDSVMKLLASPRVMFISLLLAGIGLSPYLYLLVPRENVFGVFGAIETPGALFEYILRDYYQDDKAGADLGDKMAFLLWLPLEMMRQVGFVLSCLAAVGLVLSFIRLQRLLAVALVLNLLGSTFLLAMMLGFNFDRHGQSVFMPYPIIAYASIAVWVGLCLQELFQRLKLEKPVQVMLQSVTLMLVVGWLFQVNGVTADRRDDTWVEDYFIQVLVTLPENAVLFTEGDLLTHPVGYLHYVKGVREDVSVYDWHGLVFPNRLSPVFASTLEKEASILNLVSRTDNPVFVIKPTLSPLTYYGLYSGLRQPGDPVAVFLPEAVEFLDRLLPMYSDGVIFRQQELELADFILSGFTRMYLEHLASGGSLGDTDVARYQQLLQTFPGKMMLMEFELQRGGHSPALLEVAEAALAQQPRYLRKVQQTMLREYVEKIRQKGP